MAMITRILNAARDRRASVVLPEGGDPRIVEAACRLAAQEIADPILLDSDTAAHPGTGATLPDGVRVVNPENSERLEHYARVYASGPRRLSLSLARRLLRKPLFFAAMMVNCGDASSMVAGVSNPTSRVIEAGLMAIGAAEGIATPSSFFLMELAATASSDTRSLLFADCAVNVSPSADELADIAIASAHSATHLLPEPPRVAMLSFSTRGSAHHRDAAKVVEALEIARRKAPEMLIDGEFQVDTALVGDIAKLKMASDSPVAGRANVLIFPDLDAGNIGYKLTQHLAGATAIGPILQGFAKPISDLSRGASVDDIVAACAVTLVQCGRD